MSIKKFLDLPATSSCTLGSGLVMVICDRWLDEVGCSSIVKPSVGKTWYLTLRLLGPEGRVPSNVRIDGICSKPFEESCQGLDTLAQCPTCLQIRHLPPALSFKDSGFAFLEGCQHLCIACFFPILPFLGLCLPFLFSVIKGIGGGLDHLI